MEGFTFFKSYLDQIEKVPPEHRLAAYEAICKYAIYGETPDFSGGEIFADLIFTGAKPTLDAAIRKSEAGKAGGRGNKKEEENTDKAEEKQEESKPKAEQKQEESKAKADEKGTESYKDKYMDKDKDMDKDMEKIISVRPEAGRLSDRQLEEEFEEVWSRYPRKDGKKAALRSYKRDRRKGVDKSDFILGIARYNAYIKATGTTYIQMGSTFFNEQSYNNEWKVARASPENKQGALMEWLASKEGGKT